MHDSDLKPLAQKNYKTKSCILVKNYGKTDIELPAISAFNIKCQVLNSNNKTLK